jgi:cytochrome c biogenesis protein CcmG/thiol:disulfide interchange protein DsbE
VRTAPLSLLAVAALAVALAACGDAGGARAPAADAAPAPAPAARTTTTATTASEPASALARNAADANRLVGEGADDLEARLASLKGRPVVVNQWASWCGPCRFEFPFFAAAVKRHGATVAFVGVDYMDSRDGAQGFLDEQPPGFPSVYDGDGKAARAIGGGRAMPTTLFIGADGRTRHAKLGGYAKASELDADIRRHLLGTS